MFKRLYVHNTEKIRQSWYDSFFVMLVWAVAADTLPGDRQAVILGSRKR